MGIIKFSDEIFIDYNKNNMKPKVFNSIIKDIKFNIPTNIKTSCWIYKNPEKLISINDSGRYSTVRKAIFEFFNGITEQKIRKCLNNQQCINPIHNTIFEKKTNLDENIVSNIIKDCMSGINKNEILITYNISEKQLYDIYSASIFNDIWISKNFDYIEFIDKVKFDFNILSYKIDFNKYMIKNQNIITSNHQNNIIEKNNNPQNITSNITMNSDSNKEQSHLIFIDRCVNKPHFVHHNYSIPDNLDSGNESVYNDNNNIDNKNQNILNIEKIKEIEQIKLKINKSRIDYYNSILPEYLKLVQLNYHFSEDEYFDFEDIIFTLIDKN